MKDREHWKPSKYSLSHGRLKPSRDSRELLPSSRLIGKLLADRNQPVLAVHLCGRLFDLECGKVPLYAAYRNRLSDNVCVDWLGSLHHNIHDDQFCDHAQPLPFADDSFDTILSSDVIEHLPDLLLAFKEMGGLLRPGGKLILNTPCMYMPQEIPHDYYRHTRYSLDRLTAWPGLSRLAWTRLVASARYSATYEARRCRWHR